MKSKTNAVVVIFTAALLSACGGGGSGSGDDGNDSSSIINDDSAADTDAANDPSDTISEDPIADNTISEPTIAGTASDLVSFTAPRIWSLGPASYEVDRGSQQRFAGRVITINLVPEGDDANGDYAGSQLNLSLTQSRPGDYTVVDSVNLDAGPGVSMLAYIEVSAGTQAPGLASTKWESSTGLISVRIDDDGNYHASTIEPLILSRRFDNGTGVPDSPDQISFEMQNIFGVEP